MLIVEILDECLKQQKGYGKFAKSDLEEQMFLSI